MFRRSSSILSSSLALGREPVVSPGVCVRKRSGTCCGIGHHLRTDPVSSVSSDKDGNNFFCGCVSSVCIWCKSAMGFTIIQRISPQGAGPGLKPGVFHGCASHREISYATPLDSYRTPHP
jgi:hypothetical protein